MTVDDEDLDGMMSHLKGIQKRKIEEEPDEVEPGPDGTCNNCAKRPHKREVDHRIVNIYNSSSVSKHRGETTQIICPECGYNYGK